MTVFILVADDLPPTLATIVSRCVTIPFDPVPEGAVVARPGGPGRRRRAGRNSGSRRRGGGWTGPAYWSATPDSSPARANGDRFPPAWTAPEPPPPRCPRSCWRWPTPALAPLREQHARSSPAALAEQAEGLGTTSIPGRKQIEDGHKREERRWRTDDLRFGMATLAGAYRDRLVASTEPHRPDPPPGSPGGSLRALRQVESIGPRLGGTGPQRQRTALDGRVDGRAVWHDRLSTPLGSPPSMVGDR